MKMMPGIAYLGIKKTLKRANLQTLKHTSSNGPFPAHFRAKPPSFTDCAKSRPLCASFTEGFGYFLDAIAKAKN